MSRRVFAVALFASAGLLFMIEPLFAKLVLPRLGGTPAVWTTCTVFFQAVLLLGYGYAHVSTRFLSTRAQVALQLVVLALPWLVLPIALPAGWVPDAQGNPILSLLSVLALAVGLPFFAASTSGPLLQRWFTGTADDPVAKDPYFLYAASNAGSMLGLLAYPFVLEPLLPLAQQSRIWTGGYGLLLALTAACGALVWRTPRTTVATGPGEPLGLARRLRWIALGAVPSSLMLGVTSHITTDIGTIPLLWVIPLALYLGSFIVVFARRRLVSQRVAIRALPIAALAIFLVWRALPGAPFWLLVPAHLAAFFVIAVALHGELASDRPGPERLTEFYLLMSLGGVAGGAFNALVAPLVFTSALEYRLGIVAACFLLPVPPTGTRRSRVLDVVFPLGLLGVTQGIALAIGRFPIDRTLLGFGLDKSTVEVAYSLVKIGLTVALPALLCLPLSARPLRFGLGFAVILLGGAGSDAGLLHVERSFFGVNRVTRVAMEHGLLSNELLNGTTKHGVQLVDPVTLLPTSSREALSYYHRTGPIGDVIGHVTSRRVAIVGLGTGTLAAYGEAGDRFTYYEIDPVVVRIAENPAYFTYVRDARARGVSVAVVLGDARIMLASAPEGSLDLLVLDAFSSDSIPVHLLTREALALYRSKLAPRGRLACNVSNRYLDLRPVLGDLAADAGLVALYRNDPAADAAAYPGKTRSQWVALARTWEDLGELGGNWEKVAASGKAPWTDEYSNVLGALMWR